MDPNLVPVQVVGYAALGLYITRQTPVVMS